MDRSSLMLLIRGLYRLGYDKITLTSKDTFVKHHRKNENVKTSRAINTELNRLMGFELFNQTQNTYQIKSISKESLEEFDTVLRRIFLQMLDYYTFFFDCMKRKDYASLEHIEEQHETITKFLSYCLRLLNKKGYHKPEYSSFLYHLIESMELIIDTIKNSSRFILQNKITFNKKGIKLTDEIGSLIRLFYEGYYNFNVNVFSKFTMKREKIIEEISNNYKKLDKGELAALSQLKIILDIIRESMRIRSSLT